MSVTTVILDPLLLSHITYGIIYLKIKLRIKFLYLNSFQHRNIYQILLLEIIIKEIIGWVYIFIIKEKNYFLLRGLKYFYTRKPSG